MKAAVRRIYGPPEVLHIEDLEKPTPGENELLIRVIAATANRTDCAILTGKPAIMRLFTGFFKPRLIITGSDFAGIIESVGKNVMDFKPGEKVWGFDDEGLSSHAEYMLISHKKAIARIPYNCSYQEAAASAEAAHYAYNFINKVSFQKGQTALINGATGAIGSALLQFLKEKSLPLTAVCPAKHFAIIKSLGADRLIDSESADFTKDTERFDFIFDAVGKSTFFKCRHMLKDGGVYISSEPGPYVQNLFLPLLTSLFSKRKVIFPLPSNIPASMAFVQKLIEEQKFKALIDRSYPLDHIRKAFEYVGSGQKLGNVIVLMNSTQA